MNESELSKFPLLAALGSGDRETVGEFLEVEEVDAGVALFREGEPAESALFIAEGRVRLWTAGVRGAAEVGAGYALGTLAIVDGGPCPATAQTLSRTRFFRLRREAFSNLVSAEPKAACRLLEELFRESALALRDEVRRHAAEVDPTSTSD